MSKSYIMNVVARRSLITYIKKLLQIKDAPELFYGAVISKSFNLIFRMFTQINLLG